jgi:hypothetical protein
MGSGLGGIGLYSGNNDGHKYAALSGRDNKPVDGVSF